jgi:hypothetical protein
MNLLSEITLRWYDDTSLMIEERRELVELFLKSTGVTRDVAADIFEVLLLAKAKNISLTSEEIKKEIIGLRKKRGRQTDEGLTLRNIQLWLKFFRDLGMVERLGNRYMFRGNKKPSTVFMENVKPDVIDRSADYLCRLLTELEKRYRIEKQ